MPRRNQNFRRNVSAEQAFSEMMRQMTNFARNTAEATGRSSRRRRNNQRRAQIENDERIARELQNRFNRQGNQQRGRTALSRLVSDFFDDDDFFNDDMHDFMEDAIQHMGRRHTIIIRRHTNQSDPFAGQGARRETIQSSNKIH